MSLRVDERVQLGRVRFEFTSRRARPDARPQRGKALVDAMFDFSHALGAGYTGAWLDDSTFSITWW